MCLRIRTSKVRVSFCLSLAFCICHTCVFRQISGHETLYTSQVVQHFFHQQYQLSASWGRRKIHKGSAITGETFAVVCGHSNNVEGSCLSTSFRIFEATSYCIMWLHLAYPRQIINIHFLIPDMHFFISIDTLKTDISKLQLCDKVLQECGSLYTNLLVH